MLQMKTTESKNSVKCTCGQYLHVICAPIVLVLVLMIMHGKRMCFCIKNPLIQIEYGFITEQEVEVLESFSEKKWLHHISGPNIVWLKNITNGRISMFRACVLLEGLEYLPAPILILLVTCDLVHIPQAFNTFRPKKIVGIVWPDVKVFDWVRLQKMFKLILGTTSITLRE